jgi:hypothetical protein
MPNEETVQPAGLPSLVVANTAIQQDREGRYCLNDLHRAAGGEKRHQPSNWLRSDQTKELIEELKAEITDPQIRGTAKNQPVTTYQGGNDIQGTYACKELVYAYAMWISPKFNLMVIRAFDALVTGRKPDVGLEVPHVVEHAAEATSMRMAMEGRDRTLAMFGPLVNDGDRELAFQLMIRAKERVKQYLLQLAGRHLKGHSPEQVAAWIMAWTPDKSALA